MTEKKQSTVQPEQIQGFNSLAEDELNLIDLLKILVRKKVLILAVTSVCTLFSIFYAQSITPNYRATIGLLDHKERFSSLSTREQFNPKLANLVSNEIIKPHTVVGNVFEKFLFKIKSYEFKKEVFVNGGFQKKFSRETGIDTDQSDSEIYNSIRIFKLDQTTYLQLKGSKPQVMLEFLSALVKAAKENVTKEIDDIQRSTVKTRMDNLSTQIEELQRNITVQKQIEKKKMVLEIEELHQKKAIEIEELHQKKAIEIEELHQKKAMKKAKEMARLSEALDMAKRMGIKNNNFAERVNESTPLWFLYGELALQQKIMSLKSKAKKISNTKNLSIEQLKLQRSQIADLPLLKFKVATISEHSYSLTRLYQPWVIVGYGVAFGLFISIFMAFLINLKQFGAKEIPSAST
jgi:LPS O-antigen subunit length determinant protein (WzzB/FepE family)